MFSPAKNSGCCSASHECFVFSSKSLNHPVQQLLRTETCARYTSLRITGSLAGLDLSLSGFQQRCAHVNFVFVFFFFVFVFSVHHSLYGVTRVYRYHVFRINIVVVVVVVVVVGVVVVVVVVEARSDSDER